MSNNKYSRRKFVGNVSCAALGSTTLFNTLLNLKGINALCASNSALDPEYKALVCLLKSGGNDSFNMLVPTSTTEYPVYAKTRSNIALAKGDLNKISPLNTFGRTFGVHPNLKAVADLFNQKKLSFISNIGTLIEPVKKIDFLNDKVKVPLGLFSHADQIQQWQTGVPNERSTNGWGGRLADLVRDMNSSKDISMNISLAGTNIFQEGKEVVEYVIDPRSGSIGISGYGPPMKYYDFDNARSKAIDSLLEHQYQDIFQKTYVDVVRTARDGHLRFDKALTDAVPLKTSFSDNELSLAFKMVARTISAHQDLSFKRQIFFIDFGGWDHHDEVLNSQNQMFNYVDLALSEFNTAMEELKLSKQVTTFTVSEFGRTLTSNGNGTDHAWGGNVMVMGGAVNGGNIFGTYPVLDLKGNNSVYEGVIIPTTPTDSYFAEFALWMGVKPSDLNYVIPSIGNFYNVNSSKLPIGFLNL